jgi:hypothetical protein
VNSMIFKFANNCAFLLISPNLGLLVRSRIFFVLD